MSYVMKEHLANKANYGSKRDLSKIKYLVIIFSQRNKPYLSSLYNFLPT